MAKPNITITQVGFEVTALPQEPNMAVCIIGPAIVFNDVDDEPILQEVGFNKAAIPDWTQKVAEGTTVTSTAQNIAQADFAYDPILYPDSTTLEGAVVESDSIEAWVKNPYVEIEFGNNGSIENSATGTEAINGNELISSGKTFAATGVKVNDRVMLTASKVNKLYDANRDFIEEGVVLTDTLTEVATVDKTIPIVKIEKHTLYFGYHAGLDTVAAGEQSYKLTIDAVEGALSTGTFSKAFTATSVKNLGDADGLTTTTKLTLNNAVPWVTSGADIVANYRIEQLVADFQILAADAVWNATLDRLELGADIEDPITGKNCLYGDLVINYDAIRQDVLLVGSITDDNDIKAKLGRITSRNPLALGCYAAWLAGQCRIHYLGVESDDSAGFSSAYSVLKEEETIFYVVPLSQNLTVIAAGEAHVDAISVPEQSIFGHLFANIALIQLQTMIPSTEHTNISINTTTNIITDPDADFSDLLQNDVITVTSINSVADPGVIPVQLKVVTVINNNSFSYAEVTEDPDEGSVDTDLANGTWIYSVTRALTEKDDMITALSDAWTTSNKRVTKVWPDECTITNEEGTIESGLPGYYLCAAVGGLKAGSLPHKGLSYIAIPGIDAIAHSNGYFTKDQLEDLSSEGWFVVAQKTGLPYCLWQLTSNSTELSEITALDFASRFIRETLAPYKSGWNQHTFALENMLVDFRRALEYLLNKIDDQKLGPVITAYEDDKISPDFDTKRAKVSTNLTVMGVLNGADVTLII